MLAHKHVTKIAAALMAAAVCLCLAAALFAGTLAQAAEGVALGYESALFGTGQALDIQIDMEPEDWEALLANPTEEAYYPCNVEIDGEAFYRVGIRAKGNTSLTSIASDPTTDRYSFKLEFDQYVDGQTCYGLDKLVLNNNYADATNMKEALIYDMYQYLGADASLYNYAKISINGEYWGVYLALEAVEDSFLLRNYGTSSGELYKPDSLNVGGGMGGGELPQGADFSSFEGAPPTDEEPADSAGEAGGRAEAGGFAFPGGGGGGFSSSSGGADLNYTDGDLDSYSTIWEGEVTSTGQADHQRVVTALENIAQGTDLEQYMDIDNLLKYMAVHVFSVNEDSLSGTMAHNYYLYEEDGRLNLIPWDYNLALGGMGGGQDAASVVNSPIDDAFAATDFFDTLMENEEYHARYCEYLRQLAEEYLLGDGFEAFYTRARSQLDALVETDPTAFYTYEEYTQAAETLAEVVELRVQSILGQLEGTIPSTEAEQRSSDQLVDASHLDLTVMGSMNMGAGGGRSSRGESFQQAAPQEETASQTAASSGEGEEGSSDFPPFGGQPPEGVEGQMSEGFDPSQFGGAPPEGFGFSASEDGSPQDGETQDDIAQDDGTQDSASQDSGTQDDSTQDNGTQDNGTQENGSQGAAGGPGGRQWPGDAMPGAGSSSSAVAGNLALYGVCFGVMAAALLFAKLYRRKPRRR